ncbi:nitroreductase [Desulfosporosinus orientis DSM 765]|uniref:Nitroreductase n=1 Tax=Desulfosporosinus orientis (strain ATCC 19365 / DSM 765 / NCIMB 8382 / VKM B-1628 / Singapore I) TaxID=768706 RepID=G7WGT7_DESOD|nr:nitroreductase family protein [Desulfosporosinus orientis]AET68523.1 nitroreductase [Desulfosporosinus orientis DSM 765]
MNVTKALHSRYTCRAYKQLPVDKEILFSILEAANQSSSWGNTQPWEIFVASGAAIDRLRASCAESFSKGVQPIPELGMVENWPLALKTRYQEVVKVRLANAGIAREDRKGRFLQAAQGFGFFGAPAVIFLCRDRSLTQWSLFDLGLVAQGIMLSAEQMALNTAIAVQCVSYPELIRAELNIPEDLEIIIGIAIGYGDPDHLENRIRIDRRAIKDVVRYKNV